MKFALALNLSPETSKFAQSFNQVSVGINSVTANQDYGDDIKELYIGVICVSPQFEPFFKMKKPKYVKKKLEYTKDEVDYSFQRMLEYEVKLDFDVMKTLDQESANQKLAHAILDSLSVINCIKGIEDFDKDRFKADLENFFKERDLL